jgi:hypothetical protein
MRADFEEIYEAFICRDKEFAHNLRDCKEDTTSTSAKCKAQNAKLKRKIQNFTLKLYALRFALCATVVGRDIAKLKKGRQKYVEAFG